MSARPLLRCAVYTRVSTEHGLEQEFNSLDNQREAAEAYIKSQAHEGWRCLAARYDDGGYSGGSMERPALQTLLADIQARRIDVVVVYKVDRLTRSLADFAKLVELFDAHTVSFVSVTQAFNTTTSMGRLTLNVLLSFAQFEREVTGERIRDKIAASKKKGIWMGGGVPIGYRVENRALHVVEDHASLIRSIFARYLELGSVMALHRDLIGAGLTVPERVDPRGRQTGGRPFSRGHLYAILASPIYIGRIPHKDRSYDGQHAAIIDLATFEAVRGRLAGNTPRRSAPQPSSAHLLTGRIRDRDGNTLTPSMARKGSRIYRYYYSQAVLKGRAPGAVRRVSAPDIEALVLRALRSAVPSGHQPESDAELVAQHLVKATIHPDRISIELLDRDEVIEEPWSQKPNRRWRDIVVPPGSADPDPRPMKVEDRAKILRSIATARRWLVELVSGRVASTDAIAMREGSSERSVRMTLSLASLSPRIVQAIVDGRLPRGIGAKQLFELPISWAEQHEAIGLPAA